LPDSKKRRYPALLAGGAFLLFIVLSALNAFNMRFLDPRSTGQIYLFSGISIVTFLLLVVLIVLFARNILKLFADQRSQVLGSRLRSRMLIGALILSLAPALFMFLFSYLLMNRSIDRWFSQPSTDLRQTSTSIAVELANYATANARAEAESLASQSPGTPSGLAADMKQHRITLQGGFAAVYQDGKLQSSYQFPALDQKATVQSWMDLSTENATPDPTPHPIAQAVLDAARRSDEPVLTVKGAQYAVGAASLANGGLVIVGLPLPDGMSRRIGNMLEGSRQYWAIYRQRRTIRNMYLLLLLMLTALVFFASSWLALYLSKQITRPVEALADAMNEIAQGHYGQRVTVVASQELGDLVRSFNHMASDLEQSRLLADYYTEQLSTANQALEARRNELETILETIPSGVLTLDENHRVLAFNRAFTALFPGVKTPLLHKQLEEILPADALEAVQDLERRARRMGIATAEMELHRDGAVFNLALTVASMDLGPRQRGSILVVENVSELLRAQRQVAWKEVAQRVAHEIKNPLTPVTLSAERIRRHAERNTSESRNVIRRCADIILSSAESVRRLVDQFGSLAEFPAAMPRAVDLNSVVRSAILQFENRLEGIRIEQRLGESLPPVMADAEALKRAIANLIDNAAEAMRDSLIKVLTIETALSETGSMAEIVIADTGSGLTEEMRERLFLPYFSTKQRGTGLGLTIAAKIVQDHGGNIRAEKNSPQGARFVLNLPLASSQTPALTAPETDQPHPAETPHA
jgi:two-component system, NtrC family, nitrogen regulation sensor histidine kinase NtrY